MTPTKGSKTTTKPSKPKAKGGKATTASPRRGKAAAASPRRRAKAPAPASAASLPAAFQVVPKTSLLHQAVVRHLANRRAGTADTKTRDEVAGGGRKPWRQKGTGRARHGSIRSPIWRKGGVVFGPHPRSFAVGMNKSARRKALAMAIASKAENGSLSILDPASIESAKTKDLRSRLWGQGQDDSIVLVVDRERDDNQLQIRRAARNLQRLSVLGHGELSVHALLSHDRAIFTQHALDALAEVCGG